MSFWTFAVHFLGESSVPVHNNRYMFWNLAGFDDIITERPDIRDLPIFLKPRHTKNVVFWFRIIKQKELCRAGRSRSLKILAVWACAVCSSWLCMMSWQKESRMLFAAMSRFNRCWWKERTFSSTEMKVESLRQVKYSFHTWLNPEWWTPRTTISNEVRFDRSHFHSSACNLLILFSRPKSYRTLFADCQVPLEGSL